jgi:hypothetical protein
MIVSLEANTANHALRMHQCTQCCHTSALERGALEEEAKEVKPTQQCAHGALL